MRIGIDGKEARVGNRGSKGRQCISEGVGKEEKMRKMLDKYRAEMLRSRFVLVQLEVLDVSSES